MDPVRLAIDVGPTFGHRTGVGAGVDALVAALADRDDVVQLPYLLSFRTTPPPPARRLPLPATVAHRLWGRFDHPRVDRWLGGADVVHGTNYVVPPSRAPTIVSVYDCWFLANPSLASPDVRRAGAVLRRRVGRGAAVHASSEATAARVRELLGATDVEVVHLGPLPVDDEPPHMSAPWLDGLTNRSFVLAVGTIERRKNLPALVTAFAAAPTEDAALVIAGADGDDAAALEAALDRLPPARRSAVVRVGAVDGPTKAWLLHRAAALAYPSLDEGFGFPILEAQQVGVPVVATSAGSIPEVAGDGAELVPVGDGDALAAALARVLADGDRRRCLVEAGRRNVDRFSWATTADRLAAVYHRLREAT